MSWNRGDFPMRSMPRTSQSHTLIRIQSGLITYRYARIVARVFEQANDSERQGSKTLLSWLVCAKRSISWREIQGAKSIDVETQWVDFERLRFRVDSKDLRGSLVEIRSDGTVELVHLTAKM